ncbi:MAG: Na-K-Cl cotransporter [bacterium]
MENGPVRQFLEKSRLVQGVYERFHRHRKIPAAGEKDEQKGFGTFKGVYLPSILTIFGVIMYLRLGWVVGNVGLFLTLVIVTMASAITFLTGLSISATATNMKVKGGGAYFMISRSLGVEAGAAVGLPLYLAQAVGISFYIVGFAESVHNLLPWIPLPVIGVASLLALTVLAYISADLALRIQLIIFIMITSSLVSLFLGGPPAGAVQTAPVTLASRAPFWVVFAVFFPAVTGIEAGISMSGDLKDPSRSLPLGTLAAVLTGYVVYMVIPVFLSSVVSGEALRSNPLIMKDVALVGGLILVGIWGATLSSALGALLGAPRTLQALARDRVVPRFLGKGFGPLDTPRIATAVSFCVALFGILMGDLNAIAPVLSMFFLTSYGVLNLIAGLEGLIANPSWRPTFRTPWPLSLLGAALCVAAMFMIDPGSTFMAAFVIAVIYYLMTRRELRPSWPDIRRSIFMSMARYSIYRLEDSEVDTRSWRPNILVLSGSPTQRFYLIHLADALTHGKGFLTVASIIPSGADGRTENLKRSVKEFLRKRNIPALVEINLADTVMEGARELVRTYGLGPLAPNTFLLGEIKRKESFVQFVELVQQVHQSKRNMVIVREGQARGDHRRRKKIYVWWGGARKNAGLMLALGHVLQTSPEWKRSRLVLKTLVKTEEDREKAQKQLEKFLMEGRLNAEPEVILMENREEDIIATTIRRFTQDADLVFLGMRPPAYQESPEEYASYYEGLMKRTENFPPTAIVLAAEEIKFSDIFR